MYYKRTVMTKLALAALAFATLTTGCAAMGTKRPTGAGAPITKTVSEDAQNPNTADQGAFETRADLGER